MDKDYTQSLIKFLLYFLKPYRVLAIIWISMSIAYCVITGFGPMYTAKCINSVYLGDYNSLRDNIIILGIVLLSGDLMYLFRRLSITTIFSRFVPDIAEDMVRHINTLRVEEVYQKGNSVISNAIYESVQSLLLNMWNIVYDLTQIGQRFIVVVTVCTISPIVALFVIVAHIALVMAYYLRFKVMRPRRLKYKRTYAEKFTRDVVENITNIADIKVLGMDNGIQKGYSQWFCSIAQI